MAMLPMPMTIIVTAVLVLLGLIGTIVLVRMISSASGHRKRGVCARCHTPNPGRAKFCAQCGKSVHER